MEERTTIGFELEAETRFRARAARGYLPNALRYKISVDATDQPDYTRAHAHAWTAPESRVTANAVSPV
jgi:hypothetical protein